MSYIYNTFIYDPLLNLFVLTYQYVGDFGITIIIVIALLRLILYPVFKKSAEQQVMMQRLQPEIEHIKKTHKDREAQGKAMLELFQKHGTNPFSGPFLMLFIQLPILIAFYQIILHIMEGVDVSRLYTGISLLMVDPYFFGLINLGGKSIVMLLLAAASTLLLTLSANTKNWQRLGSEVSRHKALWLLGPVLVFVFLNYLIPQAHNAIAIYIVATNFFTAAQQLYVNYQLDARRSKNEPSLP